jgi:hypothetical protein
MNRSHEGPRVSSHCVHIEAGSKFIGAGQTTELEGTMRSAVAWGLMMLLGGCVSRIETIGDLGKGYGEVDTVEIGPIGSPVDAAPVSESCLLEYNSALVAEGESACCYKRGEQNLCDVDRACNARSGANCCILYATEATSAGAGCCLYADGRSPRSASGEDNSIPCKTLLSKPDQLQPSSVCLMEYNSALVQPNEDACCYYANGVNRCDPTRACNTRSGGGCCVLYGTGEAPTGAGCCFYEAGSGKSPRTASGADNTDACNALMQK